MCRGLESLVYLYRERLALEDFAGLDAGGANANALAYAIDLGLHRLKVRVPATARDVVRVRNVISELRTFAADFAYLCHDKTLRKSNLCACFRMPRAK
jgi:hypothetical protein